MCKCNNEKGKKSSCYVAKKIFNSLPLHLKTLNVSMPLLKKNLKEWIKINEIKN